MKLEIDEKEKTALFWLTKAERDDKALCRSLEKQCSDYKEQKYLVAAFFSGEQDLLERTEGLVVHNRRLENIIADKEFKTKGV